MFGDQFTATILYYLVISGFRHRGANVMIMVD